MWRRILLAVLFFSLSILSAAPSIASLGVKNSASYANPGFQNGAIAQGSLFVVFGSGMGPAQIQYAGSFPLPTFLAGTNASVSVNNVTLPCIMIYTQDGQLAAILPSTTPIGTGTLTVFYNGSASNAAPVKVAAVSPGLFTRNQQGSGPGVITDVNGNPNSYINTFQPGQTVTFWGTGFGAISGSDANVPPTGNLPGATVTALVGGQNATVTYAGRSSDAGVDQINITIPNGLAGCFVSVGIFDNGVPANFTSIAVDPNGTVCSDADLFSAAEIQSIANGNPIRLGTAALAQYTAAATVLGVPVKIDYELGRAHFQEYSPANFLNSLTSLSSLAVSPGSCSVFQYTDLDFADPVVVPGLDAGTVLNVAGGAVTMTEAKLATGIFGGTFSNESPTAPSPPFLKAGAAFTVNNGGGGADVGAFTFNATLPPAITWTNKPTAATIPRNQNLTITWTGGDPTSFVYVNGYSNLDASGAGGEFVCVALTSAGSFTIPAAVLSAMPVSANEVLDGVTIPSGLLVVNATTTTRPTAAGLDVFLVGASVGDAKGAFAFQ